MHHLYSPREQQIESALKLPLEGMGYRMVRISWGGGSHKQLLLMIERVDGAPITLKDCEEVSRFVSPKLDTEDVIPDNVPYNLEVSSPGVERPLMHSEDFTRFIGKQVAVKTRVALNGRKRFHGVIEKTDDASATLHITEDDLHITIPISDMQSASLVFTELTMESNNGNG